MSSPQLEKDKVLTMLNQALEAELAGVVRYIHYSLMVFGHSRIPIISWMKEQAAESMDHAHRIGEWVTTLGGHPSLKIGPLLETERHSINDILQEVLDHEKEGVAVFHQLLPLVEGRNIALEEFCRGMILSEEQHLSEVEKMLRNPGDLVPARGD